MNSKSTKMLRFDRSLKWILLCVFVPRTKQPYDRSLNRFASYFLLIVSCTFYIRFQVKKPNGESYAADSIFYLVLGIQVSLSTIFSRFDAAVIRFHFVVPLLWPP
jgi:hypothetical protein